METKKKGFFEDDDEEDEEESNKDPPKVEEKVPKRATAVAKTKHTEDDKTPKQKYNTYTKRLLKKPA